MNESPQRLGKGMIYAAWLLVLGLLFFFFNHFLDKQHNPNQDINTQYDQDGTREVILQRNRQGHYVATGTINGQPVIFFLDTGATMVSIPERVANRLNLERGAPMLASTANGTITTYSTQLDNIALGGIELHKVRASINPSMSSEEILLGMSFLKHLEFTQRGDVLTLRQYSTK
jgi:aspartyl protease family protein